MKLTRLERYMISNQLRILEALYPNERQFLEHQRHAFEAGYELEYRWHMEHIYEDTLSVDECREVLDILEMFTILEHKYQQMSDKGDIQEHEVRFHGFDGNNEISYLAYARHYCEHEEKFPQLGHRAYMNSHMPTLMRYRVMLAEFKKLSQPWELSDGDLKRVVHAWRIAREKSDREYEELKQLRNK